MYSETTGFPHSGQSGIENKKLPQTEPAAAYGLYERGLFLNLTGTDQDEVDDQRDGIERQREVKHILIFAGFGDDQVGDLVAGETGDGPCGECDAVDGADGLHAELIGEQGGQVGEAAAVARVDKEEQEQNQNHDLVADGAGEDGQSGEEDGEDQDHLVDGVAILHHIAGSGEAETSGCVEHGRQSAHDAGGAHRKTDGGEQSLFLRDQSQTAGDVDVEHNPDTDEGGIGEDLEAGEEVLDGGCGLFAVSFHPAVRLFEQKVTDKHHHEIHGSKDIEHAVNADLVQQDLHDGGGDGLGRTEARNGQTGGKTFFVLEPEHERLDGGEIAQTETDTHDHTVAKEDAHDGFLLDEEARSGHTDREADGGDQRRAMDVLFHQVACECGRHTEEENGQAECPSDRTLGGADVIGDFLAERAPAINRTDAAVQQKRGNGCA